MSIQDRLSAVEKWHAPRFQPLLMGLLERRSPVYVVGGAVRDYLLGRDRYLTDLDLALAGPVLPLARELADRCGWAFYPLDEERDVARLVRRLGNRENGTVLVCDMARIRGGSIQEDLRGRDFTVNALALVLERERPPELLDVCQGVADLEARLLRRVTPRSLVEDPLRLVRAVRLKAQLGFQIEPETRFQIRQLAATVTKASPERVRDELWKALAAPGPADTLEELRHLVLLRTLLPELAATVEVPQSRPHYLDVYRHTLRAVHFAEELRHWLRKPSARTGEVLAPGLAETLAPWRASLQAHFNENMAGGRRRAFWLVWHALFHDVGKAQTHTLQVREDGTVRHRFLGHDKRGAALTAQRLRALQFSRREVLLGQTVVRHHMRPLLLHNRAHGEPLSRRSLFRFFRDTGGKLLGPLTGVDVLLLSLADFQATYPRLEESDWPEFLAHVGQMLAFAFQEDGLQTVQTHPLVDGRTLMARLNLQEGPEVGKLLRKLLEAQAAQEIQTPEEALALAERWVREEEEAGD